MSETLEAPAMPKVETKGGVVAYLGIDGALKAAELYKTALGAQVAFAHPADSRDYVATHAQEMDPSVVAKHIALYVNDYTRALDERAVQTLLDWARDHALDGPPESTHPVFV